MARRIGPPERSETLEDRGVWLRAGAVIGAVLGVAAVVFAVAAWWPASSEPLKFFEGLIGIGIGVAVVTIPVVLAVAASNTIAAAWIRRLVSAALAGAAVFVGFVWTAVVSVSRSDMGIH